MRRIHFFGYTPKSLVNPYLVTDPKHAASDFNSTVELNPRNRQCWPDTDAVFGIDDGLGAIEPISGNPKLIQRERVSDIDDIRAICLAPETDWDQVWLRMGDKGEDRLLGPGMVFFPDRGSKLSQLRVSPVVEPPLLRTHAVPGIRASVESPGELPDGILLNVDNNGGGDQGKYRNVSGFSIYLWGWTVDGWTQMGAAIADNDFLDTGVDPVIVDANIGPALFTVTKTSDRPKNNAFNLADYTSLRNRKTGTLLIAYDDATAVDMDDILAAAINGTYDAEFDSNGNPAFPAGNQPPYLTAFDEAGVSVSPLWVGRLALELWVGECPPPGYAPKLPPFRQVTMKQLTVPEPVSDAGPPILDIARYVLFMFPTLNVETVNWSFDVTGTLVAAVGSPLPRRQISHLNYHALHSTNFEQHSYPMVQQSDASFTDGCGSVALYDNAHPYGCVTAYGDADIAVVKEGSILTLKRRFIG